jgi:hypothetical protein
MLRRGLPTLPLTRAEGQAANRNRHGDCPRAIRVHLGDQSRAHATSTGVTSLGLWTARVVRCARPAHSPLCCNQDQGVVADIKRAEVKVGPRQGKSCNPLCGRSSDRRPTLDQGQPQTKKRKCGIQPAHQSLFTDVSLASLPRTVRIQLGVPALLDQQIEKLNVLDER